MSEILTKEQSITKESLDLIKQAINELLKDKIGEKPRTSVDDMIGILELKCLVTKTYPNSETIKKVLNNPILLEDLKQKLCKALGTKKSNEWTSWSGFKIPSSS